MAREQEAADESLEGEAGSLRAGGCQSRLPGGRRRRRRVGPEGWRRRLLTSLMTMTRTIPRSVMRMLQSHRRRLRTRMTQLATLKMCPLLSTLQLPMSLLPMLQLPMLQLPMLQLAMLQLAMLQLLMLKLPTFQLRTPQLPPAM